MEKPKAEKANKISKIIRNRRYKCIQHVSLRLQITEAAGTHRLLQRNEYQNERATAVLNVHGRSRPESQLEQGAQTVGVPLFPVGQTRVQFEIGTGTRAEKHEGKLRKQVLKAP